MRVYRLTIFPFIIVKVLRICRVEIDPTAATIVMRRHRPVPKGCRRRRNRCSGGPIRTHFFRKDSTAATIVTHWYRCLRWIHHPVPSRQWRRSTHRSGGLIEVFSLPTGFLVVIMTFTRCGGYSSGWPGFCLMTGKQRRFYRGARGAIHLFSIAIDSEIM